MWSRRTFPLSFESKSEISCGLDDKGLTAEASGLAHDEGFDSLNRLIYKTKGSKET